MKEALRALIFLVAWFGWLALIPLTFLAAALEAVGTAANPRWQPFFTIDCPPDRQ